MQSFYRFDSGSKEFKKLDACKSFSLVVHAIDLAWILYQMLQYTKSAIFYLYNYFSILVFLSIT